MELVGSLRRFNLATATPQGEIMHITIGHLAPIVSIVAGILILIMPRLLNFIVAIYLIIIGLLGLNIFH
jgi:hypothetical protein